MHLSCKHITPFFLFLHVTTQFISESVCADTEACRNRRFSVTLPTSGRVAQSLIWNVTHGIFAQLVLVQSCQLKYIEGRFAVELITLMKRQSNPHSISSGTMIECIRWRYYYFTSPGSEAVIFQAQSSFSTQWGGNIPTTQRPSVWILFKKLHYFPF